MPEPVRVIVQLRATPSLAAASFGPFSAAPAPDLAAIPGVQFDVNYSPVPIPPTPTGGAAFFAATASPVPPTYVVRATVEAERVDDFLQQAEADPRVVGVFAAPRIQPIAPVCPRGPVGTDQDVADLLTVPDLHARGMDGTGVRVVIVDTGVNLPYLATRGKNPAFDSALSWGPLSNQPLGNMPVGHGTMCAYDVCIAAPNCTLIDHALLTSQASGGSVMDGFLSDAVQSYGILLSYLMQAPSPFAGDVTPRTLVVNNSWGMFHPSWDFPVGSPQNYSDNPNHPFNIIVASLEGAGADILFAAGNCGTECPDLRCQGVTNAGIFGANSHKAVLSIAGVKIDKQRIGYSTKGPGRLQKDKPDIASYTHFAGSGGLRGRRRHVGGHPGSGGGGRRGSTPLPGQRRALRQAPGLDSPNRRARRRFRLQQRIRSRHPQCHRTAGSPREGVRACVRGLGTGRRSTQEGRAEEESPQKMRRDQLGR